MRNGEEGRSKSEGKRKNRREILKWKRIGGWVRRKREGTEGIDRKHENKKEAKGRREKYGAEGGCGERERKK